MSFLIKAIIKRMEDMKSKGKKMPVGRNSIILDPRKHKNDRNNKGKNKKKCCE